MSGTLVSKNSKFHKPSKYKSVGLTRWYLFGEGIH